MSKKRYLSILLLASLVIVVLAFTSFAETVNSPTDFQYTESSSGITITGYLSTINNAEVDIPSTINGKTVTSIGDSAFSGKSKIISVKLPSSVTSIGNRAFYNCTGMKTITLSNVIYMGESAFEGCSSLNSITLNNNLSVLETKVFSGCKKLSSIKLPAQLEYISSYAFDNCDTLKNVEIPVNVGTIGIGAFTGKKMTAINVSNENDQFKSIGGVLFTKDETRLLQYPSGKTGDYSVPSKVTSIREHAFTASVTSKVTISNNSIDIETKNLRNAKIYCNTDSNADRYARSIGNTPHSIGSTPVLSNTASWHLDHHGWWYKKANNSYPKKEWMNINGRNFWFNNSGYMVTGWQKIDNKWYHMMSDGARLSNNWIFQNNVWYLLSSDGSMTSNGWGRWKGYYYYFYEDGAMAYNTGTPDGYRVDANGIWIP